MSMTRGSMSGNTLILYAMQWYLCKLHFALFSLLASAVYGIFLNSIH